MCGSHRCCREAAGEPFQKLCSRSSVLEALTKTAGMDVTHIKRESLAASLGTSYPVNTSGHSYGGLCVLCFWNVPRTFVFSPSILLSNPGGEPSHRSHFTDGETEARGRVSGPVWSPGTGRATRRPSARTSGTGGWREPPGACPSPETQSVSVNPEASGSSPVKGEAWLSLVGFCDPIMARDVQYQYSGVSCCQGCWQSYG